nr:hypothetical protein StreXyl84_57320 [Streptomyces sp. Xyl84]
MPGVHVQYVSETGPDPARAPSSDDPQPASAVAPSATAADMATRRWRFVFGMDVSPDLGPHLAWRPAVPAPRRASGSLAVLL